MQSSLLYSRHRVSAISRRSCCRENSPHAGRCCKTLPTKDSHREFKRLDGALSKPSPASYRTMNWSSYTASLRKRGYLLIWLDKDMSWLATHDGSPGRPAVFADAPIKFCLTIKVLVKLPLR